jgi:uncharacterized protein YecT (DUF1311 family)
MLISGRLKMVYSSSTQKRMQQRKQLSCLAILQLLTGIGMAHAPSPMQAAEADPCYLQQTTMQINTCLSKTYDSTDRKLNQAYQKLLANLKPVGTDDGSTNYPLVRQQLIAAQQAWISYRDQDCRAKYTLFATGTIRAAVFLGCLVERTEQRTRELRAWIQEENR